MRVLEARLILDSVAKKPVDSDVSNPDHSTIQ
jgi:hypothetical protein